MTLNKAMTTSSILVAALWVTLVGGCGGTQEGQEEGGAPNLQGDTLVIGDERGGGGGESTTSGGDDKWVTLCHIPPGNHDRAHTITVGRPAVAAHLKHGDTLGACEGTDPGGGTDADGGTTQPDAGTPGTGTDAGSGSGGEPDAGPTCLPQGSTCGTGSPCCNGLQCADGVCSIVLS